MTTAWITLALTLSRIAVAAAQGNIDGTKFDSGSVVTIQGCVVAAEPEGSVVLTGIVEWPVPKSANGIFGPRHYWLDKTELNHFVGQTVQIRGTIIDLEESEVEREPSGWHGGFRVAIERPGQDVFTSPGRAGVASSNLSSRTDMKITLLRLRVDETLVVMKTCLAARRPS